MLSKSTIKYIQSLQHKKFRDEHSAFVAEGPKVVTELLQDGSFECLNVFALPQWIDQTAPGLVNDMPGKIELIRDYELDKIASYTTANNVVAVFRKKENTEQLFDSSGITLMLDNLQDPGNIGTIIRTADWFGISTIVCSTQTADVYNPKVVQSTMASLGRVNIIYAELATYLQNCPGVCKLAATLRGSSVDEVGKIKPAVLIIGNESRGISDEIIKMADKEISIPKTGKAESLNAAVAAGIFLSKLTAQT